MTNTANENDVVKKEEKELRTMDDARDFCESKASYHNKRATMFLMSTYAVLLIALYGAFFAFFTGFGRQVSATADTKVIISLILSAISLVGIFIAHYRFHVRESAKMDDYRIAFLRIRVAGRNYQKGWGSEVRNALTEDAFKINANENKKSKKIDSPIPGHPGSDISALVIDKLLKIIEDKNGSNSDKNGKGKKEESDDGE